MYNEETNIRNLISSYKLDKSEDILNSLYDNLVCIMKRIIYKYYIHQFSSVENLEIAVHNAASDIVSEVQVGKYTEIQAWTSYLIKYVKGYFEYHSNILNSEEDSNFDIDSISVEDTSYDEVNFKLTLEKIIKTYRESVLSKTPFQDEAVNNLLSLLSLILVFDNYDVVDLYNKRLGFCLSYFKNDVIELMRYYYDIK